MGNGGSSYSSGGGGGPAWSGYGGARCTRSDIMSGTHHTNNLTDTTAPASVAGQVVGSAMQMNSTPRYDCAAQHITGPYPEKK